jgi:hypothetical protein
MMEEEQGEQDRTEMKGRQDMGIGRDMGNNWRRGRARRGRRGSGSGRGDRQSRVRQEIKEEREEYQRREERRQKTAMIPNRYFPALIDKPNASWLHPLYMLFLEFATLTITDLAAQSLSDVHQYRIRYV